MDKKILETLYYSTSKHVIEHFEKIAANIININGLKFIEVLSKTINSRKIGDWGREEDTDLHLVINDDGQWLEYVTVIQAGSGASNLISSEIKELSFERLIKLIESEKYISEEDLIMKLERILN